jgi:hypothetical protein
MTIQKMAAAKDILLFSYTIIGNWDQRVQSQNSGLLLYRFKKKKKGGLPLTHREAAEWIS